MFGWTITKLPVKHNINTAQYFTQTRARSLKSLLLYNLAVCGVVRLGVLALAMPKYCRRLGNGAWIKRSWSRWPTWLAEVSEDVVACHRSIVLQSAAEKALGVRPALDSGRLEFAHHQTSLWITIVLLAQCKWNLSLKYYLYVRFQ